MLKRFSRRQLLAALGVLPVAGFLGYWIRHARGRREAALDPEDAEAISRACDRFIPSVDGRPGAIGLGIDKTILRDWGRVPASEKVLAELGDRLGRDRFLSLEPDEQDAYLRKRLHRWKGSGPFRWLLQRCVEGFYTHPQSWISLGYTKPQPKGYPDYARCG
jgi:hypothetical protein